MKKRIGRFSISADMPIYEPIVCKAIMGKCIITGCHYDTFKYTYDYVALCDDFAEVDVGQPIPEYRMVVANQRGQDFDIFVERYERS